MDEYVPKGPLRDCISVQRASSGIRSKASQRIQFLDVRGVHVFKEPARKYKYTRWPVWLNLYSRTVY